MHLLSPILFQFFLPGSYILFILVLQGQYTKITFRSPLYLGGSPSAYWLVRATGTNRGFVGCVQGLTINNKAADIRPWPLGRALSGADIGEFACPCVWSRVCACVTATGIMWPPGPCFQKYDFFVSVMGVGFLLFQSLTYNTIS